MGNHDDHASQDVSGRSGEKRRAGQLGTAHGGDGAGVAESDRRVGLRMRAWLKPLLWAGSAVCLSGCAAAHSQSPLASSLQELMPPADRDHFVYVWQRSVN